MKAVSVLKGLTYPAMVIVGISVPVFGLMCLTFLMFCDHEPFLICFSRMAAAAAVPVLQIASLIKALSLIKQHRRLPLSAALMLLAGLPLVLIAGWFAKGM
jgi:hypothetical protein